MDMIFKVSIGATHLPLSNLLYSSIGLDVWELTPHRLIARANVAQAERLQQIGYQVEELQSVSNLVTAFSSEGLAKYHTAESLENDMRLLADTRPELVEIQEIGCSVEGRPILALRIGERRGNCRKVLFMGCHHAREWVAVEVPFLLAKNIIEGANESSIHPLLSNGEIWVVPMVNPDGHEFSRTTDRLWRKNRRLNPDGSVGVDPNRNYGYMWGTLDNATSSRIPSDLTYIGPRAFSEPETRAIRDLIGRELFNGIVTYHSYSQLILYPWGYTHDPIIDQEDRRQMSTLAERMQASIRSIYDQHYEQKQSSQLYRTAGDTTDWTYGVYGIPSFTIELRPATVEQGGFLLPADQILPTFEENRPAAFDFINHHLLIRNTPTYE